jgi:hypothetical protein
VSAADRLEQLTAEELRLVRDGRVDELPAVQAERAALMAALSTEFGPDTAGRRRTLERIALLQADIVAALTTARDATARELAHVRRGRHAVRSYGHVDVAGALTSRLG